MTSILWENFRTSDDGDGETTTTPGDAQVTFDFIRDTDTGDTLARYDHDLDIWVRESDGKQFTDICFSTGG